MPPNSDSFFESVAYQLAAPMSVETLRVGTYDTIMGDQSNYIAYVNFSNVEKMHRHANMIKEPGSWETEIESLATGALSGYLGIPITILKPGSAENEVPYQHADEPVGEDAIILVARTSNGADWYYSASRPLPQGRLVDQCSTSRPLPQGRLVGQCSKVISALKYEFSLNRCS